MIKAVGITKSYGSDDFRTQVLRGIDLSVNDSEFVVILGASGSGKSTLLNVLSGLERVDGGRILYDDEDITVLPDRSLTEFRRRKIGFVFQQYYLLPNLNVEKNVKMGAVLSGNKEYRSITESLGLSEMMHKYPSQLSGGEQQRVSLARALAKNPKVLFMDEPTGALDEKTGRQVLDYISKLHKELAFTLIMVTHNKNIAQMADRVICMNSGRISDEYTNPEKRSAFEIGW